MKNSLNMELKDDQEIIEHLAQNWLNGNRRYVRDYLVTRPPAWALQVGRALLDTQFMDRGEIAFREFVRYMWNER